MLRLIIDKLGTGHNDLFLKIDAIPDYVMIADSYYMFDFLEVKADDRFSDDTMNDGDQMKYGAIELIKYWKQRIESIHYYEKKFIPFQLYDEGIQGLLVEKNKIGYKVKIASTNRIQGYGTSKSLLDQQILDDKIDFELDKYDWILGFEAISSGLDWSITELSNK